MATITKIQRKYGPVFRAAICVKGRRETATFDSKAKALTWAEETESLLRSGQPLPGELPANDMRFNEAVEKYTMAVAPRKKRNTQRWIRKSVAGLSTTLKASPYKPSPQKILRLIVTTACSR